MNNIVTLYKENGVTKNQKLVTINIKIWYYCRVPGVLNVETDKETRNLKDSSKWKLDP